MFFRARGERPFFTGLAKKIAESLAKIGHFVGGCFQITSRDWHSSCFQNIHELHSWKLFSHYKDILHIRMMLLGQEIFRLVPIGKQIDLDKKKCLY